MFDGFSQRWSSGVLSWHVLPRVSRAGCLISTGDDEFDAAYGGESMIMEEIGPRPTCFVNALAMLYMAPHCPLLPPAPGCLQTPDGSGGARGKVREGRQLTRSNARRSAFNGVSSSHPPPFFTPLPSLRNRHMRPSAATPAAIVRRAFRLARVARTQPRAVTGSTGDDAARGGPHVPTGLDAPTPDWRTRRNATRSVATRGNVRHPQAAIAAVAGVVPVCSRPHPLPGVAPPPANEGEARSHAARRGASTRLPLRAPSPRSLARPLLEHRVGESVCAPRCRARGRTSDRLSAREGEAVPCRRRACARSTPDKYSRTPLPCIPVLPPVSALSPPPPPPPLLPVRVCGERKTKHSFPH